MKARLLNSTVIPLALAAGIATVVPPPVTGASAAGQLAANPCAAKRPASPCNPCAASRKANPCNPCSAAAAGPVYSNACVVPRLVAANPCAAKRAANPCNPCAAKSAASPCNPCAAKSKANPCAAKRAANPCNPCAAKRTANPCNPCGAAAEVKLTPAEVKAVYNCLRGDMKLAYGKSGNLWAKWYRQWKRFSKQPYASSTHGGRFVSNYASRKAAGAYGRFDQGARMTRGGVLAKDSFSVTPQGRVSVGPLFLMEKMGGNFNRASGNWRYTMIMPNGRTMGTTNGKGSNNVKFCIECHAAVAEEHDSMFFVPTEFRAAR